MYKQSLGIFSFAISKQHPCSGSNRLKSRSTAQPPWHQSFEYAARKLRFLRIHCFSTCFESRCFYRDFKLVPSLESHPTNRPFLCFVLRRQVGLAGLRFLPELFYRDTFKINPIKIHPVKIENRLPIEGKGQG